MRKKILRCSLLIAVSVICTSCQILPKEEELPPVPTIKEYTGTEYEQTTVLQGDLILEKRISCQHKILSEENLSFSLGSRTIKNIYVTRGQRVKPGDLLMELEHDELNELVTTLESEIEIYNLQKTYLLERKAVELQIPDVDIEAVEARYAEELQPIEDALSMKKLRLEETNESIKEHQIRATISGVVMYIWGANPGGESVKGQKVITVADMNNAVSYVEGENAKYFSEGMQVSLDYVNGNYSATAVSAASVGLPETNGQGQPIVYFKVTNPDVSLENGHHGALNVVIDQRTDVLYVKKKAVKTSNGEKFVYMLDEEGTKIMQPVTTGLETDNYVEIISGLEKGDSVILE